MKNQRRYLAVGLSAFVSLAAFGCASDPNKNAQDARDAELAAERQRMQQNADQRSEARVNAAEVQREGTEQNATGPEATKDRVAADAKLVEAREVHKAKATERLEKANAKALELKSLVQKSPGKVSTATRDALKTVDTQQSIVRRQLDQLSSTASDQWQSAKTNVDNQLDDLEDLVKKAANDVEKAVK